MTLWAPVVYGRTAASDSWWQAVPDGLSSGGWLGTVVHSAYFRARELRERPRFLLAQDHSRRIVGVACRAATLDATMGSDGHRELFCFVGWVADRSADTTPAAPRFEDLCRDYARWAGSVYTRLMAPIWHEPPARNSGPKATLPEEVRWPSATGNGPGPRIDDGVWPEASWPALWDGLRTAAEPFTCVIGWQHMTTARFEDATHLGVADAPARPLPAPADPVTAGRVKPGMAPRPSEPVDAGHAVVPVASGTEPGPPAIGPAPRPPRGRVPAPAQLATAFAVGAVIAGAAVAALMPARTAPAPKPERVMVTVTAPAPKPERVTVTVTATARPPAPRPRPTGRSHT